MAPTIDRRKLALGLMIVGGLIAAYFFLVFDIAAPGSTYVNLGRMNDRTTGMMFGGAMALVGAVLYATSPPIANVAPTILNRTPSAPRPPFVFPTEILWIGAAVLTAWVFIVTIVAVIRAINVGNASKSAAAVSTPSRSSFVNAARAVALGDSVEAMKATMGSPGEQFELPTGEPLYGSPDADSRWEWADDLGRVTIETVRGRVSAVYFCPRDQSVEGCQTFIGQPRDMPKGI